MMFFSSVKEKITLKFIYLNHLFICLILLQYYLISFNRIRVKQCNTKNRDNIINVRKQYLRELSTLP